MGKLLLCLVVLAALVAGAVYWKTNGSPFASAEAKSCARLAKLCGEKADAADRPRCEQAFAELRKMGGDDSVKKTATCLEQADTCGAAAGCVVGGVGKGVIGEFLKGVGKAVGDP